MAGRTFAAPGQGQETEDEQRALALVSLQSCPLPWRIAQSCSPRHHSEELVMSISTSKGYLVRRVQEAPTVQCACGQSTRPLTAADGAACNLHVTFIRDSVRHYHRECTEVYYILEGRGKMELNGDVIDVEPGTVVYIEPGTRHRLWSESGVRTIVFGVPAFQQDDEFYETD
jgi:mannose-6-phosphate isomerase-like protein (cupin superfamily)